ncbi:MarR family winged helix-turn-helix transcriptional regulator [Cohnella sp. 56]|uniref:MarR family winged helix-turn-helix transcriptional regulator n=1 Tax=Cohnella sp. 56 TaxID=3113722 RepID=UPI0030EA72EE
MHHHPHHHRELSQIMSRVVKLHRRETDKLIQPAGVYPGQPPVLFRLADEDGLRQRDLAERVGLAPATLTVMLSRMEKSGLVERRPDERDQRVSRVYLTGKGREALTAVREAIRVVEERALDGFLPEERLLMRRMLLQMRHNLIESDH